MFYIYPNDSYLHAQQADHRVFEVAEACQPKKKGFAIELPKTIERRKLS